MPINRSSLRYVLAYVSPDSRYDSSASWTYWALRSCSEYTATVEIPISRAVLTTRSAISPRLATSIFLTIFPIYSTIAVCARVRSQVFDKNGGDIL